ncbi:hypothetical protein GE09DRAFT_235024 [Coniochaeta sp. 2T2.1]|nr:hypothetical protein GE09DRAFT_235024 [Coniochaeta sp. 2T2.1]
MMVNCRHSGATALTGAHIAAVGSVHPVNATFSKEVIATASFQTVQWRGQEFSFEPILAAVLARHKATSDLDSSKLTNKVSFRMREFYKPPQPSPGASGSLKRKRSFEIPCTANPVRYELVRGTSGPIALRSLPQPGIITLSIGIASRVPWPLQEFTRYILAYEDELIQRRYAKILSRETEATHDRLRC